VVASTIACYSFNGWTFNPVEQIKLDVFADKWLKVRKYHLPRYIGSDAIGRAYGRLGEDSYDVHTNNWEQFCSWVVTGHQDSEQVDYVDWLVNGALQS
jgi:hypothetical protein